MGTNFYARIIPKEEDKQKLIDAINNNQYDTIKDLASELYDRRNDYTGIGNEIHLGKRSGGWKFLWNPNVVKVWDSDACEYAYNYGVILNYLFKVDELDKIVAMKLPLNIMMR